MAYVNKKQRHYLKWDPNVDKQEQEDQQPPIGIGFPSLNIKNRRTDCHYSLVFIDVYFPVLPALSQLFCLNRLRAKKWNGCLVNVLIYADI
ncbi:hypothetical protein DIU36_09030 [Mucilaginibacter rubeus]|nr:hypothetical protein DIU36_09030 [Mucilaginibacter rubeus]